MFGSPRKFFLNFEAEGSLREPAIYAGIVGVISGVLAVVLGPLFAALLDSGTGEVFGLTPIEGLGFAVVYPAFVALAAGVYLLAIQVFIGKVGSFGQLFRMSAYAFSGMIFAWLPFIGAFAITYSLLVAMVIGIRYVFSTTLITALVVTLTGFVPLSLGLIALRGVAFQIFGA
ncbi:MAG: hypothetical protein ACR2KW_10895 [Rubrobacter sp.]